jgi:hypothetical protein
MGVLHPAVVPILRKILQDKLDAGIVGPEIALLESATDFIEFATEASDT